MELDLPLIWAAIIAIAVLAYVMLDGFDLGIGILFPMIRGEKNRDIAMNSVAPVWDGNETWLVLGGGGLFAVFPLAYATILPALYAPIVAMLIGLIFRGVSFEFRWRTTRYKYIWDWGFAAGSMLATFSQGIALGALVQGIDVVDRAYAGGWWDWLTPFSILTGVALLVGYVLLGASWLFMKTTDELRDFAKELVWSSGISTLLLIGMVSLVTPFLHPDYLERWFAWPNAAFSMIVPILVIIAVWFLYKGLKNGRDAQPFLAAQSIFALCYGGIGISFYPYMVPHSVTIWQAAAPDESLSFLLVGAVVLVPIILIYTAHAYWVFRGKVDPEQGYH